MSYKALYRAYRPLTFDEVAGQQHIVKTLQNALKENKIAHAYLFCGPRGTGKTTMARLFAKALNCQEGFGSICNECENCKAINEGRHPDVIELDAASNRGIEDIRSLISKVRYAPILGKYKVYIIDEVHMMTNEAFNALLKTLEEPPANVVFILATTEPYKLMPTILSRCQRYDFSKVSNNDIYARLDEVCKQENITYEENALSTLVSLADGGMRDALSMLDQTIAYSSNNITLNDVEVLFGLSSIEEKVKLLNYLENGDVMNITTTLNNYVSNGIDIKRLTSDLLDILKVILIFNTTKDNSLLKVCSIKDITSLNIASYKANQMIDILLNALSQYRLVSNITSLFEISLLKIASLKDQPVNETKPVEEIKEESKTIEEEKSSPKINKEPTPEVVEEKKNYEERKEAKNKELKKERDAFFASIERKNNDKVITTPQPEIIIDKTSPILSSNPLFSDIHPLKEEGTPIRFSQDDLIAIMVQGTKEAKNALNSVWDQLDKYISDPIMGKYVSLLKTTTTRIVSHHALVLESNFKVNQKKINFRENQLGLAKAIEAISGFKCIIICLNHDEYVDAVHKFTNLQQINKLPGIRPILIDVSDPSSSPTKSLAKDLQGE